MHSVNTVYAQLIDRVGPETVVETAERMGIRCCRRVSNPKHPLEPYLSAVLGTNEVNTLEMASAYGTLASGGLRTSPVPGVADHGRARHGALEANAEPERVLDPQVASTANDILNDVVLYGTGTAANIGRPQIGKTGTAMDHSDAWFVGAIPQMVAAIWVGYPKGRSGWSPPHPDHGLRRHVARADLAPADARCEPRSPRHGLPESEGGLRVGRRRRLATAVLPAQPVHAPAEHPVDGVHRRHGADGAVYLSRRCSRWSPRRSARRRTSRSGASPRPGSTST